MTRKKIIDRIVFILTWATITVIAIALFTLFAQWINNLKL
jgi:hypothetical protein